MRRFIVSSLAIPFALLVALGPVAADTGPGGNGTNFFSFSETCSTSAARTVCTDTYLNVNPDENGNSFSCLELYTFSITGRRGSFISDLYGCVPTSGFTVGSDYSVALAPTDISLQICAAHKRQCSGSAIVTVSATESVVGDVAITTTRSTTVVGGCTYRTMATDTNAELAGTITVNGSSSDGQGFLDIFDSTTMVHCK
jgi:hypothetical protein